MTFKQSCYIWSAEETRTWKGMRIGTTYQQYYFVTLDASAKYYKQMESDLSVHWDLWGIPSFWHLVIYAVHNVENIYFYFFKIKLVFKIKMDLNFQSAFASFFFSVCGLKEFHPCSRPFQDWDGGFVLVISFECFMLSFCQEKTFWAGWRAFKPVQERR